MNKDLFKMLCANYGKEPNKELHILWNEELQNYDPYYVEVAIKNIIAKDKFFPTLSRIVEELRNLPPMEIPEEEKIKRFKSKVMPSWFNKEIEYQEGEEDIDFINFIEEFRNEMVNK